MPDRELVSLLLPPLTLGLAWRRWRRAAMPDRELCGSAPLAAAFGPGPVAMRSDGLLVGEFDSLLLASDRGPSREAVAEGRAAGRGLRFCAPFRVVHYSSLLAHRRWRR